jgi:membrane protease YdiL (CAAX protease family)
LGWLNKYELVLYFGLAYLLSWSIFVPIALSAHGLIAAQIPLAYHYLGSFGPMLAAMIVISLTRGRPGLRSLLERLVRWRVEARYYAFAVLAPVGLFILAVLLNRLFTGAWPDLSLLGEADYLPYLGPLGVLGLWLLTYGLGEETGWRGYALPRLQRARPATSATLILAILWAGWHIPALFYRDTYTELGLLAFPMLLFSLVFAAMVFTWLYNSTRGSLLLVILFHAMFNWLSVSEAGGQFAAVLMTIPVIGWALYVVRRYGPENASPLEKQVL